TTPNAPCLIRRRSELVRHQPAARRTISTKGHVMAKGLNKVQLIGRLGATPEMRYTPQGNAVTTFRIAVERVWKDTSGAKQAETDWFRIVVWDTLAENCNQFLDTGRLVYVEGRLQIRKWQDQDGQPRSTTEVIAQNV